MALCDAHYRFTYVSIGSYGHDNDASIFAKSDLYEALDKDEVNVPDPEPLEATDQPLPYYVIGDDIFALKTWLMKPIPGRGLDAETKVYNYRLSSARRTIENAFGILSARWRVFMRPIRADVCTVDSIVRACAALHNYLLCTDNAKYVPSRFADMCSDKGLVEGDWRALIRGDTTPALAKPKPPTARNYTHDAKAVRTHLVNYVNSAEGAARCPWQRTYVLSSGNKVSDQDVCP